MDSQPNNKAVTSLNNKKWLLPIVVILIIQLAVIGGLFDRPEMALYDAWFRLHGVQDPGEQVVILGIDEASIKEIGSPPWPRSVHARLLDVLQDARVVGFDLTFNVPSDPVEDQAFAEAIAKHGRVVLASKFVYGRDASGEMMQEFLPPTQEIMAGAAGLGFVNTPQDPDGVVRHITAVDVNTFGVPFPSFGFASALSAENIFPGDVVCEKGWLLIKDQVIPLNKQNQALPSFWGPQATFKTYSYADVLNQRVPAAEFTDKIVLIGAVAADEQDVYPTPYTTSNLVISGALPTPGVEIHASVVQSFLDHSWYQQVSPGTNLGFLIIVGLLAAVAVSGRSPLWGLVGALAVVTATVGTVYGLWLHSHLWVNVAAPVTLIFITYAVMTAANFIQAEMGRRRTRAMFSRYVSPDVVEELMSSSGELTLGGHRVDITIMFCDIRGFTAYSENKAPEQVVNRLNEYLTEMTNIIFRHGGTLDKYLGDGLMAFFGAPVHYPDHIQRSIKAAIEIQGVIEELNKSWATKGEPPLLVGVGINSGSVLVGNVGSPERMDYTVIGEDVNLASRVEGLTKTFGTLVVISERSVDMLDREEQLKLGLKHLGHAEVKGFTEPVGVYTVDQKENQEGAS